MEGLDANSGLRTRALDIHSFGAFLPIHEFKIDQFTFMKSLIAFALDARMVDKNILSGFLGNEAKAPFIIKPLDLATRHKLAPSMFEPQGADKPAHGSLNWYFLPPHD